MTPAPIAKRLRDHAGKPDDDANRAGAAVRAMSEPPRLTPEAEARVLVALRAAARGAGRPRRGLWLQVAALLAVAGFGFGAAAALGLYRPEAGRTQQPEAPAAAARGRRQPGGPAARGASGPGPAILPLETPPTPPAPPQKAVLLIDPQVDPYRARVPREFARPGVHFTALVQVCVSDTGAVTSARVLESAHPRLDPIIKRALLRWRYAPAQVDGRPVASCPDPFRYRIRVDPAGN